MQIFIGPHDFSTILKYKAHSCCANDKKIKSKDNKKMNQVSLKSHDYQH